LELKNAGSSSSYGFASWQWEPNCDIYAPTEMFGNEEMQLSLNSTKPTAVGNVSV
jgi:hypothetical protein